MTNNSYQEPILEDCYCGEEERCDSELESEDDEWPGTENHRCHLLDLSYHYFVGRLLLFFFKKKGFSEYISNLSVCYVECPSGA